MGANFQTRTFPGTMTAAELKKKWSELCEQDRYENGRSYSGGIGMTTGLLVEHPTFKSSREAWDYLEQRAQKWEEARAVKATEAGETRWYVGAWCAE